MTRGSAAFPAQAAVLLLQLSSFGCTVDMKGDDLVVALEAQTLTTQQLGNQKLSELLGKTHIITVIAKCWAGSRPANPPPIGSRRLTARCNPVQHGFQVFPLVVSKCRSLSLHSNTALIQHHSVILAPVAYHLEAVTVQ